MFFVEGCTTADVTAASLCDHTPAANSSNSDIYCGGLSDETGCSCSQWGWPFEHLHGLVYSISINRPATRNRLRTYRQCLS